MHIENSHKYVILILSFILGIIIAYQFIHIESYSIKAGKGKAGDNCVQDIINEVIRKPVASPHVANPQPPVLLYGVLPQSLVLMCHQYAESMTSQFVRSNRKTGLNENVIRKLRKDGLVMIGGIFSAPQEMPVGQWPEYRSEMIAKLKADFGERLKTVVEHDDEPYRHCHFYVIPNFGERFDDVHPGKRAAKAQGGMKGAQNAAYIEAMRKFQDSFYENVSKRFALARLGPKRKRLARPVWKSQQAQELINARSMSKIESDLTELQNATIKMNELALDVKTKAAKMVQQKLQIDENAKLQRLLESTQKKLLEIEGYNLALAQENNEIKRQQALAAKNKS
jgi:hypothetical protein